MGRGGGGWCASLFPWTGDLGRVRLGFRSGESKCSGFIGLKGLRVYSSEFRFAHVVFFEGGQCS